MTKKEKGEVLDNLKTIRKAVMVQKTYRPSPKNYNDMANIRKYMLWLTITNEVKTTHQTPAAQIGIEMIKQGYCINEIVSRFEKYDYMKKSFIKVTKMKEFGRDRTIY